MVSRFCKGEVGQCGGPRLATRCHLAALLCFLAEPASSLTWCDGCGGGSKPMGLARKPVQVKDPEFWLTSSLGLTLWKSSKPQPVSYRSKLFQLEEQRKGIRLAQLVERVAPGLGVVSSRPTLRVERI